MRPEAKRAARWFVARGFKAASDLLTNGKFERNELDRLYDGRTTSRADVISKSTTLRWRRRTRSQILQHLAGCRNCGRSKAVVGHAVDCGSYALHKIPTELRQKHDIASLSFNRISDCLLTEIESITAVHPIL